ncbi:class I SAM-dependent DNA methyltransferase [Lichenibacterium ramalinae]|uniref:site-specific DNA-methyltransferase (adenine-specific) n=1 Tax=Lichenibacterium ramalinae TaxID=2316527 RepID=A0A4Q2RGW4_9HYPH|nr:DNA methyltransferase [Lichenibacterium ramalinae]RYB05780.1 class I SAM-dependent DNA methyltransferase [Lichenibacterium ramalinae]
MNAVEIEQAVTNLAWQPFDPAEFPFAFLQAFGNKDTTLKRLRKGESNKSDCGGILQTNNVHIATAPAGDVTARLAILKASPATARTRAKFILATDGDTFEAEDLVNGETLVCRYSEFPDHFGFFLPLAGISVVTQIRENAFDIRATSRLNRLYVELRKLNPDWDTAERQPDMNHFMARLIFCFFAESTDIFDGDDLFTATIAQMSDRTNTHEVIGAVFRAMNVEPAQKKMAGLPRWAEAFPYVNGGLFSGNMDVPRFSPIARSYLLHIGALDWKLINPDIFGSMIQAVADDEERGALGMHYTSVPNILKVLNPLFLNDLRTRLEEAGRNQRTLLNLRRRLARIRVFDPACGSGNFLVIAYKEMRAIEVEVNRLRGEPDRRSDIPLTNFRGIELRDFPAEIARLALIIAEYQCNVIYRGQKEALADFLPLDSENWITCGNALRLDWLSICPPTGTGVKHRADELFGTPDQSQIDFNNEGGETYICGNPQFKGARKQSRWQKADMALIFGGGDAYKDCDYVMAWYLKACEYSKASQCDFAFVSTNSISRGEQVEHLWSRLYAQNMSIFFCHTQFKWSNNAADNAGVWCVIIGVTKDPKRQRLIYTDGLVRRAESISPYLIPGREDFIRKADRPVAKDLPRLSAGSMARDDGNLILTSDEMATLAAEYPAARSILRPLIGTSELKQGSRRWCLWISDEQIDLANSLPPVADRIERVRTFRAASKAKTTQGYARIPHKFAQRSHQDRRAIVIPKNTPDGMTYVTPVLVEADVITTDLAFVSFTDAVWVLAILSSTLHRVWAEAISGGLGSGVRYSSQITYNAFPLQPLTEKNKIDLERCGQDLVLAREHYFPCNIAELYDPDMLDLEYPLVRQAHNQCDEVLERIYIGRRFRNDTERLEKLFETYTRMTSSHASDSMGQSGMAGL